MAATEFDMVTLVREVIKELVPPGSPVQVDVGSLPHARGDRAMLHQVLVNLLANALKFSRGQTPPVIAFGGAEDDHELRYWVKDNGVGFDPAQADKLFTVFQRLHRATEFEGTGIGLAIVKRIVNRHGGRVWAESKVGEGATIGFTLPRAEAPAIIASGG
jgi:signal transduction histidine kinase